MQYKVKRTDSLSHHGILGMKGGKRNGPPYPLASGDHSASEKKAGWRKSLKDTSKKIGGKVVSTTDKVFRYKKEKTPRPLSVANLLLTTYVTRITNSSIRMGADFIAENLSNKPVKFVVGNTAFITSGRQFVHGLGVAAATYNTIGTSYNAIRKQIDSHNYKKNKARDQAIKYVNSRLDKINKKYEGQLYKDKDFKEPTELGKKYEKEIQDLYDKAYSKYYEKG